MTEQSFTILLQKYLGDSMTKGELDEFITTVKTGENKDILLQEMQAKLESNSEIKAGESRDEVFETILAKTKLLREHRTAKVFSIARLAELDSSFACISCSRISL